MRIEEILAEIISICNKNHVTEVILFGSQAKGMATERSDIDIVNMDNCKNQLLLREIEKYGRKIL